MITTAANNFADAIMAKKKQCDDYASMAAVEYAQTDNKSCQGSFKKYTELSEMYQKLYGEACQAMHAIEAEMQRKLKAESSAENSKP